MEAAGFMGLVKLRRSWIHAWRGFVAKAFGWRIAEGDLAAGIQVSHNIFSIFQFLEIKNPPEQVFYFFNSLNLGENFRQNKNSSQLPSRMCYVIILINRHPIHKHLKSMTTCSSRNNISTSPAILTPKLLTLIE